MKKVSIVMPVYNGEEYLNESIESILKQTYTNFEFIIVCEYGSSEKSIEIIKKFKKQDKRIIYVQNDKKEGISESLNIGLKLATGEYIARMDSDDISMPKRIETQVNYLENNLNIGLCGIQPTFFGNKMDWNVSCNADFIKHAIFFYSPCVHPTIMFRSSLIKDNNIYYNKDYKASEDYDFFAKISKISLITNINDNSLFKYRLHQTNATFANNDIGLINYSVIMKDLFKEKLNLEFNEEEISLLNCHLGLNGYKGKELLEKYIQFDLLLKKILVNSYYNGYNVDMMFQVLKKRFNEIKYYILDHCGDISKDIVNSYLDVSIFNYENFDVGFVKDYKNNNPEISVLLPVYNSEDYIIDSILSILNQSYKNFELIILYEYGISDNTLDYIKIIPDKRIKIIKNKEKLGLAASLNEGIKLSKGKYIARIDGDDLAKSNRFEKQINLFVENPQIDICSTWQKHFGKDYIWIHKTPYEDDKIKALLLFECCICHSTVMFKKDKFINNNLLYRTDIRQEDYELWCRASECCNFAVIQEVLGLYRLHSSNITMQDLDKVSASQVLIVKNNMKKLNINVKKYRDEVFVGFQYLYDDIPSLKKEANVLFKNLIKNNNKLMIYDQAALKYSLDKRKKWINKNDDEQKKKNKNIFDLKYIIKKMLYPIYKRFKYRMISISEEQIDYNNKKLNLYSVEKINNHLDMLENKQNEIKEVLYENINNDYIKLNDGEKIRIVFIMQAASFWPSFESVYNELVNDTRFDFRLFLLRQENKEKSQFHSCKTFLEQNDITYEELTLDILKKFNPHIAIMQTPYDKWHRDKSFYSENLRKLGIRLVYIPYGIEFGGMNNSIDLQFGTEFINNMWRIYTINKYTKEKICIYSNQLASNVKVYGSPKFDGLVQKKCLSNVDIRKFTKGRKIVVVKIHFPQIENDIEIKKMYTPDLKEYIKLLNNVDNYKDLCFVVMPHPKLFDNEEIDGVKELREILENNKDILVFYDDDYRQLLYEADYFITDRSAVAIEIGYFNKPVLFLENENNKEEYIECFDKLFKSYENGSTYEDIEKFLKNCIKERYNDLTEQQLAFKNAIINLDGRIGKRIIDDLYNSIIDE